MYTLEPFTDPRRQMRPGTGGDTLPIWQSRVTGRDDDDGRLLRYRKSDFVPFSSARDVAAHDAHMLAEMQRSQMVAAALVGGVALLAVVPLARLLRGG